MNIHLTNHTQCSSFFYHCISSHLHFNFLEMSLSETKSRRLKNVEFAGGASSGGFGLIFVGWEQNLRGVAAGHQGWIELR